MILRLALIEWNCKIHWRNISLECLSWSLFYMLNDWTRLTNTSYTLSFLLNRLQIHLIGIIIMKTNTLWFCLLLARIIIGESSIDFQWIFALKWKGRKENVLFSDHVHGFMPFAVFNQLITSYHIIKVNNTKVYRNCISFLAKYFCRYITDYTFD